MNCILYEWAQCLQVATVTMLCLIAAIQGAHIKRLSQRIEDLREELTGGR